MGAGSNPGPQAPPSLLFPLPPIPGNPNSSFPLRPSRLSLEFRVWVRCGSGKPLEGTWVLSPVPQQGHWGFWFGKYPSRHWGHCSADIAVWGTICSVAWSPPCLAGQPPPAPPAQWGGPHSSAGQKPSFPTSSESQLGWKGQVWLLHLTTGETKAQRDHIRDDDM